MMELAMMVPPNENHRPAFRPKVLSASAFMGGNARLAEHSWNRDAGDG
jgi:hypothetical protein